MDLRCTKCDTKLSADGDVRGKDVTCPKCHGRFHVPERIYEYRVVTQKELCGTLDGFDCGKAERVLNDLALQGWRVVSGSTFSRETLGCLSSLNHTVLVLERERGI